MTNEQEKQWREDLRLTIAIQLQQHDEVMTHDPTKCYVPELDGLTERASANYINDAVFHRRVDSLYYAAKQSSQSIIDAQAQEIETLKRKLAEQQAYDTQLSMLLMPRMSAEEWASAVMGFNTSNEELTKLLSEAKQQGIEEGRRIDVDWLSNVIRSIDGAHSMAAGELAEKIVETIRAKGNK